MEPNNEEKGPSVQPEFNFMGMVGQMGVKNIMDLLPMIAEVRQHIPRLFNLVPTAKHWEATLGLEKGEIIEYSAMLATNDGFKHGHDGFIYVKAISQVEVETSPGVKEKLVRQRILKRYVASELIDLLEQYIPNV